MLSWEKYLSLTASAVGFLFWVMLMRDIEYCMRYAANCNRCPKYRKCEREYQRELDQRNGGESVGDYVTCKYCGIVPRGHVCTHRKSRVKSLDSESVKFRNTKAWMRKSIEIKRRDRYLCQCCLNNLYNTLSMLSYKGVEVHHITSIREDYNRRLDNNNLITLCSYHHKMADRGEIPKEALYRIIQDMHRDA